MYKNSETIKNKFISDVLFLLEVALKEGKEISYWESVADGHACYLLRGPYLLVGGSYGTFADEVVCDYLQNPQLSTIGAFTRNNNEGYCMQYYFDDVKNHMTLTMASKILEKLLEIK